MSDERDNSTLPDPGAPIEEQAASDTAVQAAVDRASTISDDPMQSAAAASSDTETTDDANAVPEAAEANTSVYAVDSAGETTAGNSMGDHFAAAEEAHHREEVSKLDTVLNIDHPTAATASAGTSATTTVIAEPDELPSAAADPVAAPAPNGDIRISADHPMAALYMQTPLPPDLKGNRGAGILIALLGALAFAVLYAGLIAVWLAPTFPPSTFLTEGLLPWVTSWGFIAGVVAFFVGLVILVLIFGRAGWWAYVIFSLFVGVLVWATTSGIFGLMGNPTASFNELAAGIGANGDSRLDAAIAIANSLKFGLPTLGAAILAREVAVWFGAWIGARGRKVSRKNAELLAEYETAVAEAQAKQ